MDDIIKKMQIEVLEFIQSNHLEGEYNKYRAFFDKGLIDPDYKYPFTLIGFALYYETRHPEQFVNEV